jgi:hypothetical protein
MLALTLPTPASSQFNRVSAVRIFSAPYDYYHDRHQAYYIAGLREALAQTDGALKICSLQRFPLVLSSLRRVRSSYRLSGLMDRGPGNVLDHVAAAMGGSISPPFSSFHSLVGQYEFTIGARRVKLFLDAQARGEIPEDANLENCDVYAKSNYRYDVLYPSPVVPLCTGNPLILPHLSWLRNLRDRPLDYDLCFVVRVWGGRHEDDGVEHNLRLLEAVNKARCRKRILAYLVAGDVDQQESRLRAQGIPTTREPVSLRRLWEISASARMNLIRLGMHNCIPWRFVDLLAMGACPVFDQFPQTQWAAPLDEGIHYLQLGAETSPDEPLASDEAYEQIPARIEEYVRHTELTDAVRIAAAEYFDRHACPAAVGRRLLRYATEAALADCPR